MGVLVNPDLIAGRWWPIHSFDVSSSFGRISDVSGSRSNGPGIAAALRERLRRTRDWDRTNAAEWGALTQFRRL